MISTRSRISYEAFNEGILLSNALDGAEAGLAGTNSQEGDGLVDTAERRDINGLATDSTGGTNTGG